MKIPTYNSQVSPSGQTPYRSVADVRTNDLEKVVASIDSIAGEMQKRQDEQIAIQDYTNMANADLAITQLGEQLKDEIANGGKYSDATKRFNEGYAKIQAQFAPSIKDAKSKAEFAVRTQRAGLQYNLSIKDAVRSRSKADATTAASNKVALLQDQLVRLETSMGPVDPKARQEILGQMASTMAPLEAMGVLSKGEGSLKMRKIVADAEQNILRVMVENDPVKARDRLEKSYQSGTLDPDTYASMLGPMNNAVEALNVTNKAFEKFTSEPEMMSNGDVGVVFNEINKNFKLTGNEDQYKADLITLVSKTQKIPVQIENQMTAIMAVPSTSLSAGEAETFSDLARVAREFPPQAFDKLPKQTQAAINFVNDQVDSGIPVNDAVKRVSDAMASMSDPKKANDDLEAFRKRIYKEGDFLSDKLDSVALLRALPGQQAFQPSSDMIRQFETSSFLYSKMGYSDDKAQSAAVNDIKKVYQPFDGKMMKYSPTFTTGLPENKFKEVAIQKPLAKAGLLLDGAEYRVVTDLQAESEFLSGDRVTYPIYVTTGDGVLKRMTDKNGINLRTMPIKVSGYKPYSLIESTREALKDEEGRGMLDRGR